MTNQKFIKFLQNPAIVLAVLGIIKFIIPLITHPDFELHRDEFLYMAMGDHLDTGYLEVPPFIAVLAWISKYLLGGSHFAVRFFPALSGALTLLLTGLIAKELGGRRFAQILAGMSYILSLVFLRINLFFMPVTFDVFFFVLASYLLIRILKNNKPVSWIWLGVVVGIGILNKYTMLLFGFGMLVGLLATPYRKYFLSPWIWLSTLIALVIWSPNLYWQAVNDWPFFEHMRILSERQLSNVQPHIFILVQLLMNLHALPVWLAGYLAFQFSQSRRKFRPIAYLYTSSLLILLLLNGKTYYLAAVYPVLFAAGAVVLEKYFASGGRTWMRPVLLVFLTIQGIVLLPVGIPILSEPGMISYFKFSSKYLGVGEALRWETGEMHLLPQDYADMLGWQKMVEKVAEAYHSLPPEQRQNYAIFAANYGEAGAIDYYGHLYGLPKCISKGSSYWLWGYRNYDGKALIVIGLSKEDLEDFYKNIDTYGVFRYRNARESGVRILVAREPQYSIAELWQILKKYRY